MAYTVYKHTSPAGKVYIGITGADVKRRWKAGSPYKNNPHFYSAIKKYGWENFRHEILAVGLSKEDACEMEIRLIAEHQSTDPAKGYNHSKGGDKTTLGYSLSAETRSKISHALKGKRLGIPHTAEHAARIAAANRGRKVSDATKQKLREALGDRLQTEKARAKQKENTPRGAQHHRAKAVICLETGDAFPTIAAASKAYGIYRNGITECCEGRKATTHGYHWAYLEKLP